MMSIQRIVLRSEFCDFRDLKIGDKIVWSDSRDGTATVTDIEETCMGMIPENHKGQTRQAKVIWYDDLGRFHRQWLESANYKEDKSFIPPPEVEFIRA